MEGPTGDSHDNELAEMLNGLNKAEIIHRQEPWTTRQVVELVQLSPADGTAGLCPSSKFEAS